MSHEVSVADLSFLAGNFLYGDIPENKSYLLKYFKTESERIFISYFVSQLGWNYKGLVQYGFYLRFTDHTGRVLNKKWVEMLRARVIKIEKEMVQAITDSNLEMIATIKSGQYKDLPYMKSRHKSKSKNHSSPSSNPSSSTSNP